MPEPTKDELIFEAEAGVKIVQRFDGEPNEYELVMPSGNRNIWFTDREAAIYCAAVVGSCWLEAEACGAAEERATQPTPVEKGDGLYEVTHRFGLGYVLTGPGIEPRRYHHDSSAAYSLCDDLNAAFAAGAATSPPVTEGREDGLREAIMAEVHRLSTSSVLLRDVPIAVENLRALAAALDDGRSDALPSVPVAETDVDQIERGFLRVPPECLPEGFYDFLRQHGFEAWYGAQVARRAA